MTGSDMNAIEEMVIQNRCRDLIFRFAAMNDAGDYNGLAWLFTSDGSFARPSDPDNLVTGRHAIAAHFRDRPSRASRHVMMNVLIDVESPAIASAHSLVLLFSGNTGPSPARIEQTLVGDFHDRFRLVDGCWLFEARRGSIFLKG